VQLDLDEPDPADRLPRRTSRARSSIAPAARPRRFYRLAWRFSAKTLRDGVAGHEYDGARGTIRTRTWSITPEAQEAIRQFYALEARGLRRAVTVLREWQRGSRVRARSGPAAARVPPSGGGAGASYKPAAAETRPSPGIPGRSRGAAGACVLIFRRARKR